MERGVPVDNREAPSGDQLTATWVELAIRIGVLALLLYWTFTLVRPFVTIAIWSAVLTVALYPAYDWMVSQLGGRRRMAAALLTILNLLIVIGPITWLVLGLIGGIQTVSERLDPAALVPAPPDTIKSWPLVGEPIYQFWDLASSNLRAAFAMIVPQLKPLGSAVLQLAADAGSGTIKFFVAIVVAGFLFSPAPSLLDAVSRFSRRVASARGEEFVRLAGATIRTVSRGVIGISVLQALLAGLGLLVAGVPAASLLTFAVLILGIIQIGPSIVLIPLIIWSWMTMDTSVALLFTAYMIPVSLLDNILRPLVMGRGLSTPMPIILLGVIGGTISYGITGLFLGPIVLAVFWELLVAWLRESENAQ
jgi:predicted PurR-regulated permease PerM